MKIIEKILSAVFLVMAGVTSYLVFPEKFSVGPLPEEEFSLLILFVFVFLGIVVVINK